MRVRLLGPDVDFDAEAQVPPQADALTDDLGLQLLWEAMAAGDSNIRKVARVGMLLPLLDAEHIRYRQAVLNDALHHPDVVRDIYALAGQAIDAEKSVFLSFFSARPETRLNHSVRVLELLAGVLASLRRLAEASAPAFRSAGFQDFFQRLCVELDDRYLASVQEHFRRLRFKDGLLLSSRLGPGNQGVDFVIRTPHEENRSMFNRGGLKKPHFSFSIPDRDEGGFEALGDLRDHGLEAAAAAAADSAQHVKGFFVQLRLEAGFLIGCLNLAERLRTAGQPLCFPDPLSATTEIAAQDLREAALALRAGETVVGNNISTAQGQLMVITGANQGGKSTFLRSLGSAQLMMQAGMYVAARTFAAPIASGVFTHFRREEDATMSSGKLDEELARMRGITDLIRPGGLLLSNESFAATNEREGAEIASVVVRALVDNGVRVALVTHNYELARSLYEDRAGRSLFLRAERRSDGRRTYVVGPGEPLPTSYGKDVYARVFGRPPGAEATVARAG